MKVIGRTLDAVFEDQFRKNTWTNKYGNQSPSNLVDHISTSIAQYSILDDAEDKFYDILMNCRAIPGGRIMATFNKELTDDQVKSTPMNCYVIPILEDSIKGIFDAAYSLAKTFSWGGGGGTDISALRPRNAPVRNTAKTSTGAVSFQRIFHESTASIGQEGRRGALLLAMSVYHPDILEFIQSKIDGEFTSMNISVKIFDTFMQAIQDDKTIELWYPHQFDQTLNDCCAVDYIADCYNYSDETFFYVRSDNTYRYRHTYRTIRAQEVWDKICESAWKCGDPGVVFWDKILENSRQPLHCVNPCGELPLAGWGACALGSLNLSKHCESGQFDQKQFGQDVETMTHFLDSIISYAIDNNLYPIATQSVMAELYRPIGVGLTGLADAFILSNVVYGSAESIKLAELIGQIRQEVAEKTSHEIGKTLGPYQRNNIDSRRNSQLTTVAPTGTVSLILGCSTGIEPNFAFEYQPDISFMSKVYHHPLLSDLAESKTIRSEDVLIEAHKVKPLERIAVQAAIQKYTDGSISSTINLPKSTTKERIDDIYQQAFRSGCKGVTIFREGSKKGYIESVSKHSTIIPANRIRIPFENPWYLILGEEGDEPNELFIWIEDRNESDHVTRTWVDALTKITSLYLQTSEGSIQRVVRKLYGMSDGQPPRFRQGWVIKSEPDAIAKAISMILANNQYIEAELCPSCSENEYLVVGGCGYCRKCGFSECD